VNDRVDREHEIERVAILAKISVQASFDFDAAPGIDFIGD
jgi:hypothetical protein